MLEEAHTHDGSGSGSAHDNRQVKFNLKPSHVPQKHNYGGYDGGYAIQGGWSANHDTGGKYYSGSISLQELKKKKREQDRIDKK